MSSVTTALRALHHTGFPFADLPPVPIWVSDSGLSGRTHLSDQCPKVRTCRPQTIPAAELAAGLAPLRPAARTVRLCSICDQVPGKLPEQLHEALQWRADLDGRVLAERLARGKGRPLDPSDLSRAVKMRVDLLVEAGPPAPPAVGAWLRHLAGHVHDAVRAQLETPQADQQRRQLVHALAVAAFAPAPVREVLLGRADSSRLSAADTVAWLAWVHVQELAMASCGGVNPDGETPHATLFGALHGADLTALPAYLHAHRPAMERALARVRARPPATRSVLLATRRTAHALYREDQAPDSLLRGWWVPVAEKLSGYEHWALYDVSADLAAVLARSTNLTALRGRPRRPEQLTTMLRLWTAAAPDAPLHDPQNAWAAAAGITAAAPGR